MKYVLKGEFIPGERVLGEFEIRAKNFEDLKGFLMDGLPRVSSMMFSQVIKELLKVDTSKDNKIAMLGMLGLCSVQETSKQITKVADEIVGEIERGKFDDVEEDDEEEDDEEECCGYCEKDLKECKRRGRKKH